MTWLSGKVRLMFDRNPDAEREVSFAHNIAFQQVLLKVGSQKKSRQGDLSTGLHGAGHGDRREASRARANES